MSSTFNDYLKKRGFSPSTVATHRKILGHYLQWLATEPLGIEQVRYQDLLSFIRHCSETGKSQRTIHHYLNTVKHYYDHLAALGQVTHNPTLGLTVKGIKRKILYPILAPHELHQLYHDYPTQSLQDRRNKALLGLLAYQGLRTAELARLTLQDVHPREGQLTVIGSRTTNGRTLPLSSHQVMDLYDYQHQVRPALLAMDPKRKHQTRIETDQLFIGEGGHCYSLHNLLTQVMTKARKLYTGLKNAQQVRVSVITQWVKTYNLRKAQYLAGHRNIRTTEGYLQNDMEGLKEEVNQYHPLG